MNRMVRMDEYCSSVRDGTHDTPKPTSDGKYLVTSKAIHDNTIDFSSCYFISQKDFDKINARSKVDEWDVLMTMIGSVGRLLLVQNEPDYAIKNIALFKIGNEDKAKWLYFYLSNKPVQDYFEAIASGTSQHFIGLGHLRKLKIADFNENSKKVVSILSAYDNLIENNNKRIKILEQMAENLYKEWFVCFRFPGHETTPLENGIPKGWSEEKLSAVFEVKYGKDHKNIEEGLIPIFGSGGIMRYGNKALCSEESVLIPRKGSLNNVMYYKGDFWTVDTMFYTKMKIKHCAKYTYFTLSKVDLEGLNSGASIPSMTTDILYHLKMIVPDESTLIAFDKQIDLLFAEKDSLELQNPNLIKQRDLLLPRLMSGKLKVQ